MRFARLLALVSAAGLAPAARADVLPHPIFTDHMVLQRGGTCPVWGLADPGEKVEVMVAGGKDKAGTTAVAAVADDKGNWKVGVAALPTGTGYTLTVKGKNTVEFKNVAFGDVWVCSGQSNMEWSINASWDAEKYKAAATNKQVRLFTVAQRTSPTPLADQKDLKHFSGWAESSPANVGGFSAVAYHFGQHLQKNLPDNVPVGLIHTSWGGTPAQAWASTEAMAAVPELKYYADAAKAAKGQVGPGTPASLYNAMIHPLLPFAIKGAIWYQGESNAGKAAEYRTLFPTMIRDWRAKWGQDFPFLCVQLAPWHANDADGVSWAELREAQLLATQTLPKVGMAVITDVGDLFDIHPKDKFTVGTRLGLYARGMVYDQKIVYSGPVYKSMTVEGDKAVLSFDHVGGGLGGRYGTLNGFEICGKDHVFRPARAQVKGETVVVSAPGLDAPVAVRFGWKNYPVVNLFNMREDKKGVALPATPFRTDDFPLTTAPQPAAKK
ncbi:MAG TPA: sialate O-acetylesterase [Urbifossiella sp.]|jgi:sialate O-acetylesterase|nr:sialate O-acetylesterase [Urbifossiella sp.]